MKAFSWVIIVVILVIFSFQTLAESKGDPAKGKLIYAQFCALCHGETGKGDGLGSVGLDPKPRNHTDNAYMSTLTDQYLYDFTYKGGEAMGKSPGMLAFGATLTPDQIWDVIAYVRTLHKK